MKALYNFSYLIIVLPGHCKAEERLFVRVKTSHTPFLAVTGIKPSLTSWTWYGCIPGRSMRHCQWRAGTSNSRPSARAVRRPWRLVALTLSSSLALASPARVTGDIAKFAAATQHMNTYLCTTLPAIFIAIQPFEELYYSVCGHIGKGISVQRVMFLICCNLTLKKWWLQKSFLYLCISSYMCLI